MEPPRELLLTLLHHPSHTFTENEIGLLWKYLCPLMGELTTVEGRTVKILRHGEIGQRSGPDVTGVKLRLDGVVRSGDVEIHRQTSDWYHHEHHRNSRFNTVVLHLVLTGERASVRRNDDYWVDTLVLGDYLDQLKDLLGTLSESDVLDRKHSMKRPCFRDDPDEADFRSGLETVSQLWLDGRAARFRKADSDQILRCFIAALGYARNHEPFRKLGRRLDVERFRKVLSTSDSTDRLEGYLLGVGGWFTDRSGSLKSTMYRRRRAWDRGFSSVSEKMGDQTGWKTAGVRPHARPVRRWICFGWASRKLYESGIRWSDWCRNRLPEVLKQSDSVKSLHEALDELFALPPRNYWRYHYSLNDRFHETVPSPMGTYWYDQLAINFLLPYLYYRGITTGDPDLHRRVKSILSEFPSRLNNRRTRRMEQQWGFETGEYDWMNGFRQQGAIHLYKKGCKQDRCERCPLNTTGEADQVGLFSHLR